MYNLFIELFQDQTKLTNVYFIYKGNIFIYLLLHYVHHKIVKYISMLKTIIHFVISNFILRISSSVQKSSFRF